MTKKLRTSLDAEEGIIILRSLILCVLTVVAVWLLFTRYANGANGTRGTRLFYPSRISFLFIIFIILIINFPSVSVLLKSLLGYVELKDLKQSGIIR